MEAMDLSFEDFGSMMRSKFDELYGVTRKEADVGLGLNANSKRNPALSLRILWDIETLPSPRSPSSLVGRTTTRLTRSPSAMWERA